MSAAAPGPTARITGHLKGRLSVVAHQARDLQSKQMLGTMDPYCLIQVKSEKIKSSVHTDGGRTPKWEHAFVFNIDCEESEVLQVRVMNKELVSDDTIGLASIAMKDLVIYHQVRRWYQLVDKNNYSKIAGAIEMTVDYQGDGVEYFLKLASPTAATTPAAAVSASPAPYYPPVAAAAPAPAPAPAPALAPAAAPYYPQAAAPAPYGYPPQPAYGAPPQPAYAPPPAGYYPPQPAYAPAPYGYPPQPAYYAPPVAQPQVVYAAPPHPTVIYQQPQPEVVIIEERPLFW